MHDDYLYFWAQVKAILDNVYSLNYNLQHGIYDSDLGINYNKHITDIVGNLTTLEKVLKDKIRNKKDD